MAECGANLEMSGLALLENSRSGVAWADFAHIVHLFQSDLRRGVYQVYCAPGIGEKVLHAAREPGQVGLAAIEQTRAQQRVGIILAKALPSLLHGGHYGQDLRTIAWEQPCSGLFWLNADQTGGDTKVIVNQARYPAIILGSVQPRDGHGPGSDQHGSRRAVVQIAGHRLACWLKQAEASPPGPLEVLHACHHRPWCVNLHCLSWGTRQHNLATVRRRRGR